jgi:hypothetical protein
MRNDWPDDFEGRTWILYDPLGRELERDIVVFKHGLGLVSINGFDYMRAGIIVSEDCRRIDLPLAGYLTR